MLLLALSLLPLCLAPTPNAFQSLGNSKVTAVQTLDALKDQGTAALWRSAPKLAPRQVTLNELCQTTSLPQKALDPTKTDIDPKTIADLFTKTLLACTAAAALWLALPIDDSLRFTGAYLIAGVPIAILAIGSSAPSLLFLPYETFMSAKNKEQNRERICRHEAAHLLTAYCLGLPAESVSVAKGEPQVSLYDEDAAAQPGYLIDSEVMLPKLAVVAVAGLVAEADAFGGALGASADLRLLDNLFLRSKPPIPAQAQQGITRYAALMAWTILKTNERALNAVSDALYRGEMLGECLRLAEEAERK